VFRIITKEGSIEDPLCSLPSFRAAVKWCVENAHLFGDEFEIWYVERFKHKKDDIWLEAEYEVLP
jgi:hypothetical protein